MKSLGRYGNGEMSVKWGTYLPAGTNRLEFELWVPASTVAATKDFAEKAARIAAEAVRRLGGAVGERPAVGEPRLSDQRADGHVPVRVAVLVDGPAVVRAELEGQPDARP